MDLNRNLLAQRTRRQLFEDCGVGVGKVALTSLFVGDSLYSKPAAGARGTHHEPRAKSIIYLFMGRRAEPIRALRAEDGTAEAERADAPAVDA